MTKRVEITVDGPYNGMRGDATWTFDNGEKLVEVSTNTGLLHIVARPSELRLITAVDYSS